jgi:hypothetical protein
MTVKDSFRTVAVFQLAMGVGVITWWAFVIPTGRVPEIEAGERAIWFHIAAELLMAGALIAAGIGLRLAARGANFLSALALGTLAYSCVNSAGYFADTGSWAMVAVFGVVLIATGLAFVEVVRGGRGDQAETPAPTIV